MSNVVINESPITSAIKAIPNALSSVVQAKTAQDQNAWNKQMQRFEMDQMRDAKGMNAGGYNNQEIMDYFSNLALSKGKIISGSSGLDWTGTTVIPTLNEALDKYKQILNAQGKRFHPTQDTAVFTLLSRSVITLPYNLLNIAVS